MGELIEVGEVITEAEEEVVRVTISYTVLRNQKAQVANFEVPT